MAKTQRTRRSLTYARKRLIEKTIRAHIDAELPKFKDFKALAESLSNILDFQITPAVVQGMFRDLEDLDRNAIIERVAKGEGPRKPLNRLREEVQRLSERVEKLESFVKSLEE